MSKIKMSAASGNTAGLVLMAVLSLGVIGISSPLYQGLKGPVTLNQPEYPLADGTYSYTAPEPDSKGYTNHVTMTVENGIIVSCVWNPTDADGNGKQKLSMEGLYVMTEDGPSWKSQADTLGNYIVEHQKTDGLAKEDGYTTDAVASVSINVNAFINGVEECLKQAAE